MPKGTTWLVTIIAAPLAEFNLRWNIPWPNIPRLPVPNVGTRPNRCLVRRASCLRARASITPTSVASLARPVPQARLPRRRQIPRAPTQRQPLPPSPLINNAPATRSRRRHGSRACSALAALVIRARGALALEPGLSCMLSARCARSLASLVIRCKRVRAQARARGIRQLGTTG